MKGTITVHDRYAHTVGAIEERELKVCTITDVFKDTKTEGTVIAYMVFGEVDYLITKETPEEVETLLKEASKEKKND